MSSLKFFLIASIVIISFQCEDNGSSQNSASDCGLEVTFIKDIDNIDDLGNASGSAIKMLDDCTLGH